MGGVRGFAAAVVVALGTSIGSAWAGADDDAAPMPHLLWFSGGDLWGRGGFAYGGALWAPGGLDHDGFVVKVAVGGGLYAYHSDALGTEVTGRKLDASILPGWRWRRGDLFITVFGGLDLQRHSLSPDDPTAGLRGNYAGLKAAVELWYQPTPTTMIAGDASASTIGPTYSGRLAYGWRVLDKFYIGPEIGGFSSTDTYQQVRAGIHITGLKFSSFSQSTSTLMNLDWSAGLGIARDSDRRESVYLRLGVSIRQ
jgi:hypothetical protein